MPPNNSNSKVPFVQDMHHFEGYTILKRKDKIIQVDFKSGYNIAIDDARQIVRTVEKIKDGDKCLFLVVFEEDNTFSKETREYISSDAVSQIIKADAFVIKGLALEILGQGYLRINKPNRPTRLFKSAAIAAMWLMNHLD
jgi:hypothetical protein